MIKVYFESTVASELVATFESEDTYIACLPALKKECKEQGWSWVSEKNYNIIN